MKSKKSKSSLFNINANIIVLISYLGGLILMWIPTLCYVAWIVPLLIYITESKNKYIKDQSSQSLFIYLLTSILSIIVYIFLRLFSSPIDFNQIYNILASGSLIIIILTSMLVSIIKILASFFIGIAAIKSWNYENYEILYLKPYLKIFRKYLIKLEERGDNNKDTAKAPKEKSSSKKKEKVRGRKLKK